jgi:hypothetical protein
VPRLVDLSEDVVREYNSRLEYRCTATDLATVEQVAAQRQVSTVTFDHGYRKQTDVGTGLYRLDKALTVSSSRRILASSK